MKTPTLLVLPNPYAALDKNGMPAGAVRYDPEVGRPGVVHYIGVEVTKKPIDTPENKAREQREQRRETTFVWAQRPLQIPGTAFHVDLVRTGQILAADQPTARACKIWFVPPAKALEQARQAATARWEAERGEKPPVDQWDAAVGPPAKVRPPVKEEPLIASPFAPEPTPAAPPRARRKQPPSASPEREAPIGPAAPAATPSTAPSAGEVT
jgi:hypothetical protein